MKRMHRVSLAMATVAFTASPAAADHWWGGYHWARQTAGHAELTVNYSVDSAWAKYVVTSIADWENPVRDQDGKTGPDILTLHAKEVKIDQRKCNPIAGQILVCNYAYGQRGWLGIASVWADGSKHITQATTKLNDSYYKTGSAYDNYGFRAMVACQEVGHDFGLAHQNENFTNLNVGSCMDYTNNPEGGGSNGPLKNDKPNYHDYEELGIIYGHADTYTTGSAYAATNFGIRQVGKPVPETHSEGSGDTAAEWGSPIHRDGKGRPDQFVRTFRDGTKMITHVFWAPDAKGTEAN